MRIEVEFDRKDCPALSIIDCLMRGTKARVISIELTSSDEIRDVFNDVRFFRESILGTFCGVPVRERK